MILPKRVHRNQVRETRCVFHLHPAPSPEPLGQYQFTAQRNSLGVQNPLAVRRDAESEVAIVDWRDHFGLARGETEKLYREAMPGSGNEVDAIVHDGVVPAHDGGQNLCLFAAGYRHLPQAGVGAFSGEVEPFAIGRLGANEAAAVRNLKRRSPPCRPLPYLRAATLLGGEVNPFAAARPPGNKASPTVGSETPGGSAFDRDHIYLRAAFDVGVKRDLLSVRRPGWCAGGAGSQGSQLGAVLSLAAAEPVLGVAAQASLEGNPAAVG